MTPWSTERSRELYSLKSWGAGFFEVSRQGTVEVTPQGSTGPAIDIHELVHTIQRRGVATPLLLRFDGILRTRVRQLNEAFRIARKEFEYPAPYRSVFPIKVNQDRRVIEAMLEEGRKHGMGLEVGSKPELIAGIALQAGEGALLICNGYKDRSYVEMALLSSQLGITPVLVIEKLTELGTIIEAATRTQQRPRIGVRVKLASRSTGRWQDSAGDRSKFGLTTREIVSVVETLREHDMLDCLELLHFHIGSQIANIRAIKRAMQEATQVLVGLSDMGVRLRWFDAGGGLGVDYDGSNSASDCSTNYSLQEYANDVVWHLAETCARRDIEPPTILTESGRALVAHHSVLVTEVIGRTTLQTTGVTADTGPGDNEVVQQMAELTEGLSAENYIEYYHDAQEQRERASLLFNMGQLSLPDRARTEELFWRVCQAVLRIARTQELLPDDLVHLERDLSDTYFVNASIFQSIPDAWAIGQLFPIVPLHHLDEEPVRRAVLADLTCDSDGRLDKFIDRHGVKAVLELHEPQRDEPYLLGIFLVGAYQEILGDIHNLFGDTNVAHVDLDERGQPRLSRIHRGDRIKEVLSYVDYNEDDLLSSLRRHVEDALDAGRLSYEESALFWTRYEAGLHDYTYLTPTESVTQPDTKSSEHQRRVHR